jgi:hypothetical protein
MIARLLSVAAILAALFWVSQSGAQFNGCQAGFCNPPATASCSATLALDGHSTLVSIGSGTTIATTLTTTGSSDVAIFGIEGSGAGRTITGVAWTGGTPSGASAWAQRTQAGTDPLYEWYATLTAPITSQVITATFNSAVSFASAQSFAISGASTSSPFDSNGSLPATTTTSTAPSVSTSNANDFIFGILADASSTGSAGAGFTAIGTPGQFQVQQYVIKNTTQSGLSVGISGDTIQYGIADAVKRAC